MSRTYPENLQQMKELNRHVISKQGAVVSQDLPAAGVLLLLLPQGVARPDLTDSDFSWGVTDLRQESFGLDATLPGCSSSLETLASSSALNIES